MSCGRSPTPVVVASFALLLAGCSACVSNDPSSLRHRDSSLDDSGGDAPDDPGDDVADALDDSADVPVDVSSDAQMDVPDAVDSPTDELDVPDEVPVVPTEFVTIGVGASVTFTMGAPDTEPGYVAEEGDHSVTLTHDFEIMVNEVRQDEFEELMGYNNSGYSASCGARCPVETVTWHEAARYANLLSTGRGYSACYDCDDGVRDAVRCTTVTVYGAGRPYDCPGYRLPTEAEWEYSARAGTTTSTYNGDIEESLLTECEAPVAVLTPISWFCLNSLNLTHPVKMRDPNAWGLFDMLGNVREWCQDWYSGYEGDVTDPWGPVDGAEKVIRGGSWLDPPIQLRCAFRDSYDPVGSNLGLGFRLVRSL